MICAYCGQEDKLKRAIPEGNCTQCGAPLTKSVQNWKRTEPFFYEGYVVWCLRNWEEHITEYQFWKGIELRGSITITDDEIRFMPNYQQGIDMMPDIFLKFLANNPPPGYQKEPTVYCPADGCGLM